MSEFALEFDTPFLNTYMQLVEDTESPRLFHVWSAIAAVAGTLGRRCWLPFGGGNMYPNHFVLLVGTPGTRKSTAMGIAKKQVEAATGVRIAPGDTGGQRQGIISALQSKGVRKEVLADLKQAGQDTTLANLDIEQLAQVDNSEAVQAHQVATADKHHLMAFPGEFTRFIGHNNPIMLDFLGELWDGENIKYQLKNEEIVVENAMMNLLGCTTPVHIAQSMPPNAGGQGFLSRVILVYGANKYRSVARPAPFNQTLVDLIRDRLGDIYNEMGGEFEETPDAFEFTKMVYEQPLEISDPRFMYYGERRFTHMLKLGMVLAAMRLSRTIMRQDYVEADRILRATERGMPEALGQFGLSPIAQLKQGILDFLRNLAQPVSTEVIRATFHRDARPRDIAEAIADLVSAHQVKVHQTPSGGTLVSAVLKLDKADADLMNLLAER